MNKMQESISINNQHDALPVEQSDIRRIMKNWHNGNVIGQEELARLAVVQQQRLQNGYGETNEGHALALRDVLGSVMDEIKAVARQDDLADDQWIYYAILVEQFINRRKSDAVQDELALGRRAFFNKQKQALSTVAQKLSEKEAQYNAAQEVAAPPETISPPDVRDLVGRQQELVYFKQKLAELNYAVIVGFPGSGKTLLAAKLVRESGNLERVFWYQCRTGDSVDSLLWALASFLVSCGEEKLWRILYKSGGQTGQEPMPLNMRLDYALRLLAKQDYLICLDDFQTISDDPDVLRFATQLYELTQNDTLRLLITSRAVPSFIRLKFDPLTGLTVDDVKLFIAAYALELPPTQLSDLHTNLHVVTEGHPLFLNLALDVLRETGDVETLMQRLPQEENIEQYLLQIIDQQLSHDERVVMGGIAVLGDYGGERAVIETVIGGGSIRRPLRELSMRNLLSVRLGANGREYSQHAIVRTFYNEELGLRERKAMHWRAGHHFAEGSSDALRAALHFQRADEKVQAAELAVQAVDMHLYHGYARQLRHLLESIECPQDGLLSIQVDIALGRVYTYLREVTLAQDKFEGALEQVPALSDATSRQLTVRICRELAALLKSTAPADALVWVLRGLDAVDKGNGAQEAELLVFAGIVQLKLGDNDAAQKALARALELSSTSPTLTHQLALINLGIYHFLQNNFAHSRDFMQQALTMAEAVDHPFNALTALSNLAILHHSSGEWETASQYYTQAAAVAADLGNMQEQARLSLSSGVLWLNMGDHVKAHQQLAAALNLARTGKLHEIVISCLSYLADLSIIENQLSATDKFLSEAQQLAQKNRIEYQLPFIAYHRANYHLLLNEYADALNHAQLAVDAAQELGMDQEVGLGLRVLGKIQLYADQPDLAVDSFQQSLELLVSNPYEHARTKVVLGQHLLAGSEQAAGRELLQSAHQQFELLGAERDIAEIASLLESDSMEN